MKYTKKKTHHRYCSPANKKASSYTCFSLPALKRIVNAYNENNTYDPIIVPKLATKYQLWSIINKKMKKRCNEEWCWIQQSFLNLNDRDKLKDLFRPKKPKSWKNNPREWLSSEEIENVMVQYEKKHKNFIFIGPVPIDFDHEFSPGNCVTNELCKINVNSLKSKGKTQLAVVFNLDKHYQPGSHWNALFVDIGRKGIYFFDSYASKPPKEIKVLMERLKEQYKKAGIKMRLAHNTVRNQFKGSECGVYCLNFIVNMLETNISFKDFINKPIPDDEMFKKREFFFI